MYLKSIQLQNTGPIDRFSLEMPFENSNPKPLVLVGPNGSGKSTVLSFLVNALLTFKQFAFEESEVAKGRVYKMRSPRSIRHFSNFYRALLTFDNELSVSEWQLDQSRADFEDKHGWTPINKDWMEIPDHENSHFHVEFGSLNAPHKMEGMLNANCTLYFAADRFEPPDWLNTDDLSPELKLPDHPRMRGKTARRIVARNRLKPTMEWLSSVAFDVLLQDVQIKPETISGKPVNVRVQVEGPSTAVYGAVVSVLSAILCVEESDVLELSWGNRQLRIVSAQVSRAGEPVRLVRDLLSLSAGESALFCIFAGIIQDADLAQLPFKQTSDIKGIVAIDEADLHLHLNLQYKVFPRLLSLFPKVQFIITAHSPMLVLGLDSTIGTSGFLTIEMPTGRIISPETYSEFLSAFEVFAHTRKFEDEALKESNSQPKPVLLVEGKSDEVLVNTAWSKLYPKDAIPFLIIGCGVEPTPDSRSGGAEMLRRCIEFLAIASQNTMLALFDNDRTGNEQFAGVNKKAFDAGKDTFHKVHKSGRAHAILLPILQGRELFVTLEDTSQRYLAIEHYFSNKVLESHKMAGPKILSTEVFEIIGDKVAFANKAKDLSSDEFGHFALLFDRIFGLLQTQLGQPK